MADIDAALEGIYDKRIIEEKRAESAAAYEEKIVKKILIAAGMEDQINIMKNDIRAKTGKPGLTFAWFYEQNPTFPIYLEFARLPYVYQTKVTDLFNKFESLSFYKEWLLLRDEYLEEDHYVGLVFDFPGIKGTQMIIHDAQFYTGPGNHFCSSGRVGVVLEPFDPFLKLMLTMSSSWIH